MVHYRIHNCRPPVPILSQLDPVHILTFHLSLLPCLRRTKVSVQVRGFLCERFATIYVFTVRLYQHFAQPTRWRTTPRRLSATAYSIYLQLRTVTCYLKLRDQKGRGLYGGIIGFQKGIRPRSNIVKDEKDDLFTDCQSILARYRKHFCQLFSVHGVSDIRQTYSRTTSA